MMAYNAVNVVSDDKHFPPSLNQSATLHWHDELLSQYYMTPTFDDTDYQDLRLDFRFDFNI